MKKFLIAIALMVPFVADAQFSCLPAPLGNGTAPHLYQRDGIYGAMWWCDKTTHWAPQYIYGTSDGGRVLSHAQSIAGAADFNAAALGKFNELRTAASADLEAFKVEMHWELLAMKPADPVLTVATNAGRATRPAYPVIDAVRSTKADGTAPVGATCQCLRLSITEGRSIYCAFDATPRVAYCTRQR